MGLNNTISLKPILFLFCGIVLSFEAYAGLPETIAQVRPSVVGIGTIQKTRVPKLKLQATGFVVADGLHVITNAHVLSGELQSSRGEHLVVLVGSGRKPGIRQAEVIKIDKKYDLALLKLKGLPIPSLRLGDSNRVREGDECLFTGFPIGAVLGLYPVTHRSIISAITPVVIPSIHSKKLTAKQIRKLKSPYNVFQLDAIAYPGNSGSPLYSSSTGKVIGVVNNVLVKESKESVLSNPSGIAYAIPVKYVRALLRDVDVSADHK